MANYMRINKAGRMGEVGRTLKKSDSKILSFSYKDILDITRGVSESILKSSFFPDVFVAVGTGGLIPAKILKNFIDTILLTVTVKRYNDDNTANREIKVYQWLDKNALYYVHNKNILLIDDVDDGRDTLLFCIKKLEEISPSQIGVFTLFNKLKPKSGDFPPEVKFVFYGREIDDVWIKFPWEL